MSDKNKITKLESKRNELVRSIYTCAHHKKKIINLVQELSSQHERDRISHREYSERLFNALDKRTPEHWINYYDEKIRDYNNQLNVISEEIKREEKKFNITPLATVFAILILLGFGLYLLQPTITGLIIGDNATLEENITLTENVIIIDNITIEENLTLPENITEEQVVVDTQIEIEEEVLIQGYVEINKPVKWVKRVKLKESTDSLTIRLSDKVSYVKVSRIVDEVKEEIGEDKIKVIEDNEIRPIALTGYAVMEPEINNDEIGLIIDEEVEEVEIEYYTEGPGIIEKEISNGKKEITVYSDVHYENILAYTSIDDANRDLIKLYRTTNGVRESTEIIDYVDDNNNGLIDEIRWIVPSLSNETYEVIIEISKAVHLDENKEFISDIYNEVYRLDNNWSEEIENNEYVRVTFKKNLTSERDITIYPRIISGNPRIEVYDENNLIADFSSINSNEYNKIYLTNLVGSQDTFDLRIIDGTIEIDHIIDPMENIFYDAFTGTAATLLTAHAPNIGTSWTQSYTAGGNLDIESNGLQHTGTTSDGGVGIANPAPSTANYNVSVLYVVQDSSDDTSILVARYLDVNNFYAFKFSTTTGNTNIHKRVASTCTVLDSTILPLPATGNTVKLSVAGNTISVYVNEVLAGTATDNSLTEIGYGGAGVGSNPCYTVDDISSQRLDDFNITEITPEPNNAPNAPINVIINSTSISQLNYTTEDLRMNFYCDDNDDNDILTYHITVHNDTGQFDMNSGCNDPQYASVILDKSNTSKYSNWSFSVNVSDDSGDYSATISTIVNVTIRNSNASITTPAFNYSTYNNVQIINVSVVFSDDDNDANSITFEWFNNNALIRRTTNTNLANGTNTTDVLTPDNFVINDQIIVQAFAFDGNRNSSLKNSTTLTITPSNSAPNDPTPTINSTFATNLSAQDLHVSFTPTDSDAGETLTYDIWAFENGSRLLFNINSLPATQDALKVFAINFENTTKGSNYSAQIRVCDDSSECSAYVNTSQLVILNTGPQITNVSINPTWSVTVNGNTSAFFSFSVRDDDNYTDIDNTNIFANFSRGGEITRYNNTNLDGGCKQSGNFGKYIANYSCTINIVFYDGAGDWNVSLMLNDKSSNYTMNKTVTFNLGETTSFSLSDATFSFPDAIPNTHNITASDAIYMNNTGNDDIASGDINITAVNIHGDSIGSTFIPAKNFTISSVGGSVADSCDISLSGIYRLVNKTIESTNAFNSTIISTASLPAAVKPYNEQTLFMCLLHTPGDLTGQTYSTDTEEDWSIIIS